ncbi:putative Glutaredoxin family protein [Hibiscus syriacus]|uniref:Homeobox-leucine zipper protein n=1 Tax=Hibiscus syriacus TaxID=106335 RepID=A0A6A3AR70_HIBSY|nr:putative Glutaredoxin family protein [Hibiscus syriacus]
MIERVFAIEMAFPPHAFIFQTLQEDQNRDHLPYPYSLNSLISPPPQLFHDVGKLEEMPHGGHETGDNESSDDGSHHGEKKRRLNMEQIAIWFQNRRARCKNNQLEKDYDSLKKLFEALKADNHALQAQNRKLTAELLSLKKKDSNETRINNENEGSCSNGSEESPDLNLDISTRTALRASSMSPATNMVQILECSSKPVLHGLKLDHGVVQEDPSLACHMFNGADEQQGFWPWAVQSIKFPLN